MTTAPACGSCGSATGDGARLCQGCTRELAITLLTAASIAPDLDDAIARLLRRGGTGGKSTATEAPLPIDLAASDAASALRVELAVWAYNIRRNPSDAPFPDVRGLARWLAGHLSELSQYERAGHACKAITAAVRRALAAVDRLPERVTAGTCQSCGAQLLAELGADTVTCACGTLAVSLLAKRRERAAAADVLGTPGEISGALDRIGIKVSAPTIRKWASRGRLAPRPGGHYALSDVLALCAQRDSRR